MKKRLYVSTFSQNADKVINENGLNIEFNQICISEMLDKEKIEDTIKGMSKYREKVGGDYGIVHGPFTEIIPASIDHRAVDMGLERLNEAFYVANKLGVNRLVFHSGYMPLLYFKEWHLEKSKYFWDKFLEDKPDNLKLYIENVFEEEPYMLQNLIKTINDSRVKLCLDIGHANAVKQGNLSVENWIEILGEDIGHFHLHNNNGINDQHASFDQGDMNLNSILNKIEECCDKKVTLTIESSNCEESVAWLKQNNFI